MLNDSRCSITPSLHTQDAHGLLFSNVSVQNISVCYVWKNKIVRKNVGTTALKTSITVNISLQEVTCSVRLTEFPEPLYFLVLLCTHYTQ